MRKPCRRVAWLAALAGAVSGVSCAPRGRARLAQVPATGVAATFERHVQNAVDAGEGDYRLRDLRERMARQPDSLPLRLELARYYQQHGSPELALEHYRLAAVRFPESAELHLAMARCLAGLGLNAEAAQVLADFLGARPQVSPDYASWLGILEDRRGRFQQGEAAHRAALALAPGRDGLHNNLGYNLLEQRKYEQAAAEFHRALELNPRSKIARNNLALAEAAADLNGRRDAASRNNLGAFLIEQGRYGDARKQLELALAAEPNFGPALNNLRLVSELDRRPVTVTAARAPAPGWKRFLAGLRRGLLGE